MKRNHSIYLSLLALVLGASCQSLPQLGVDPTEDVVAAMTLDEKVRLLVGPEMDDSGKDVGIGENAEIVPGAAGSTYAIPRLGITPIVMADGPSGLRIANNRPGDNNTYYTTQFPSPTLLAATWHDDMAERIGRCIGKEALDYGVDILLAPAINIQRDPLNGRNFEYFSESQILTAIIGLNYVQGIQAQGVGATIKHLAVNNQETNRQHNDAILSQRALRDIYLRAFRLSVREAEPYMVMTSYNKINGQYTSQSKELLDSILRGEWQFKGAVVSDWYAGTDPVAMVEAGNDLLMPGKKSQYDAIIEAVEKGKLDTKTIDRNVTRILEVVKKTPRFQAYAYPDKTDLKAHANVALQAATDGLVLLKNDKNVLPLKKANADPKVALLGTTSYDFIYCGTGSGNVKSKYKIDLQKALNDHGFNVDNSLQRKYIDHIQAHNVKLSKQSTGSDGFMPSKRPSEVKISQSTMQQLAAENDAAIITIGRIAGEFVDLPLRDFNLHDDELRLIDEASKAFHSVGKPVIVLLNVGGPIATTPWDSKVDAVLVTWYPGQEGTNAIARVLSGEVSPSGHLPMTFPKRYEDTPTYGNFPTDGAYTPFDRNATNASSNRRNYDYTVYAEDVFVGYRHYDTYDIEPAYPFGHGLSYTTFEMSNPTVEVTADNIVEITVDVTNTGNVPGREVVQAYVHSDNNIPGVVPYKRELRYFDKTKLLQPGQTETLTLRMTPDRFGAFDPSTSSLVVEKGQYEFYIGNSIDNTPIVLTAEVPAWKRPQHKVLAPQAKYADELVTQPK